MHQENSIRIISVVGSTTSDTDVIKSEEPHINDTLKEETANDKKSSCSLEAIFIAGPSLINTQSWCKKKEKRFLCDVCGKGFTQKNNMQVHKKRHKNDFVKVKVKSSVEEPHVNDPLKEKTDHNKESLCAQETSPIAGPSCIDMQSSRKEKRFFCDVCGNGFTQKNNLYIHKKRHKNDLMIRKEKPIVKEPHVDDSFKKESDNIKDSLGAQEMGSVAGGSRTYVQSSCKEKEKHCGQGFTHKDNLQVSEKEHKKDLTNIKEELLVEDPHVDENNNHKESVGAPEMAAIVGPSCNYMQPPCEEKEKPFLCDVCGKRYTRKDNLQVHKRKHKKDVMNIKEEPIDDDHFKVETGNNKEYPSVASAQETGPSRIDMQSPCKEKEKPFLCDVCGKGYARKDNLQVHKRKHKKDVMNIKEEPLADDHFKDETGNNKEHPSVASAQETGPCIDMQYSRKGKEKCFQCDICGKGFTRKDNLRIHKKRHNQDFNEIAEKSFVCLKCGNGYTTKGHLQRHLKAHKGEKPFECLTCGKGFLEKHHLDRHLRIHTGEKPFVCHICGRGFTSKENLRAHLLIHTGETPFVCPTCRKGFKTKHHLERHSLTHTGEKPFLCPVCSQGFTQQYHLKDHILNHSDGKPFPCKLCGEMFASRKILYRHRKQKHLIKKELKF